MTSQLNSRYAFKVIFAIALIGMVSVAGLVGRGNSQTGITQAAGIDVSALHASADITTLPDLSVAEPF